MRTFFSIAILLVAINVAGCKQGTETAQSNDSIKPAVELFADQGSPEANEAFASQTLVELKAQLQIDIAMLREKVAAAGDQQNKVAVFARENPIPAFVDQAWKLVRSFPDSSSAFDATMSVFSYADGEDKIEAMELMLDKYSSKLNHTKVMDSLLGEVPAERIEQWLRKLVATAPEGVEHAKLLLGFKTYFDQIPEFRVALRHNPQVANRLPEQQLAYIDADMTDEQRDEIAGYLQTIIDEYPEIELRGRSLGSGDTYGEVATQELYELHNLGIGMLAPEIEGNDLDGAPFRLSDYRGKIVMLDFWGQWCPPCRAMFPHERYIVERLSTLPFALIGVNSDASLEVAKRSVEEEILPWRNFWNGPEGTAGPISRDWCVSEWPTLYLIDGDGIIRHKGLRGEDLERALESLLAEIDVHVNLSQTELVKSESN